MTWKHEIRKCIGSMFIPYFEYFCFDQLKILLFFLSKLKEILNWHSLSADLCIRFYCLSWLRQASQRKMIQSSALRLRLSQFKIYSDAPAFRQNHLTFSTKIYLQRIISTEMPIVLLRAKRYAFLLFIIMALVNWVKIF